MKFNKIVSIGIPEDLLDTKYWEQIDQLTGKRVSLEIDANEATQELAEADCLLLWFNGADKDLIDKAPNLKYIGALATGVGKIDVEYAVSKGITVTNIPAYSKEAVAELVFAVLLEQLRDISRAKIESKQARTLEEGFSGREIKGRNFGIVGLGRIGGRIAEIANAFGANVHYWSRNKKTRVNDRYKFEELPELVAHCDFLSINLALNSQTEGMLDAKVIESIKKDAIVVNTAPMELLDFEALNKRLEKKDLTFIFDHTDPGDISDEDLERIRKCDNCITYPVLGYITDEAKLALQVTFVENIENFLGGNPVNTVS